MDMICELLDCIFNVIYMVWRGVIDLDFVIEEVHNFDIGRVMVLLFKEFYGLSSNDFYTFVIDEFMIYF